MKNPIEVDYEKGQIYFDLDGTLAEYDTWMGPEHIGEPIASMVSVAKQWIFKGYEIVIFTARASDPSQIPYVEKWAREIFGMDIKVTNSKGFNMVMCYDDRAVQVEKNTGRVLGNPELIMES